MKTSVRNFSAIAIYFLTALISTPVKSQSPSAKRYDLTGPLGFIENKGQFRDQDKNQRTDLLYMYLRQGLKVQVLPATISFELYTIEDDPASVSEADGYAKAHSLDDEDKPIPMIR